MHCFRFRYSEGYVLIRRLKLRDFHFLFGGKEKISTFVAG